MNSGDLVKRLGDSNADARSFIYSADGKYLLTGNEDGTARLLELSTLKEVRRFIGHSGAVWAVAYSANDSLILTGGGDKTARLWNAASGKQVHIFKGHGAGVSNVSFLPDGQVLTVSLDRVARVWDTLTGKEVRRFTGYSTVMTDMRYVAIDSEVRGITLWNPATGKQLFQFSPDTTCWGTSQDGRYLAVGLRDGTAQLTELETGRQVQRFTGHSAPVSVIVFSPDGRLILTGGGIDLANGKEDHSVRLWDIASGKEVRHYDLHSGCILNAAFSRDSRLVATCSLDRSAQLWEAETGKKLYGLEDHPISATFAAFSPDGQYVLTGSMAGITRLWDVTTGSERQRFGEEYSSKFISSGTYSRDERFVLTGGYDGRARLWDVDTGKESRIFKGYATEVKTVSYSPDGKEILAGMADGVICVWGKTGNQVRSFGHSLRGTKAFAYSPDGRHILTGDEDGIARLLDVNTGKLAQQYVGNSGPLRSIAFSPDGQSVITAGSYGIIEMWETKTGRLKQRFVGHTGPVTSVMYSPDGRNVLSVGRNDIYTGARDDTARLWSVATGREERRVQPDTRTALRKPPTHAVYSPDGRYILLINYLFTSDYQLQDASTGKRVRRLNYAKASEVTSVAFSNDGKLIAIGHIDGDGEIVDVETGEATHEFTGHAGSITSINFSSDRHHLITGSVDRTIKLWDLFTEQNPDEDGISTKKNPKQICRMVAFQNGGWVVVDDYGRFDTNTLEEIIGLHYVDPQEAFKTLPLEIFQRDYYNPRLLTKLLDKIPDTEQLIPVKPLKGLNRLQPKIERIVVIPQAIGLVTVKVNISSVEGQCFNGSNRVPCESGVYDLRLYRDGQLVSQSPDASPHNAALAADKQDQQEQLLRWRNSSLVKDVNDKPITVAGGKREITFTNVRLPQRASVSHVEFTAYAFNEDRVKGSTPVPYTYEFKPPPNPAPRRAYVITVGVNANQSGWNLDFAAKSAADIRQALSDKLSKQYEVVDVQLLSTLKEDGPGVALKQATKANIRAVLDLLAGHQDRVSDAARQVVDPNNRLGVATPDDLVVLFISSHGYADPQGNFYVIPYDTGKQAGVSEPMLNAYLLQPGDFSENAEKVRAFLEHSISSDELAQWWKDIDAGEMMMILDSCHSAAVPGREFRPGPLGDRGFGQLSYDKRMRILSATQPDKTALATLREGINRSLLSDALINALSANPQLELAKWLTEAERRVPEQYRRLFPEVKEEDIQFPLLLDFTIKNRE